MFALFASANPGNFSHFFKHQQTFDFRYSLFYSTYPNITTMSVSQISQALPALPEGWSAEKDFKPVGHVSAATRRNVEPVGPHFLAHARRLRHKRTFSEDDRIQAEKNVKKTEDEDAGEISEPEDPSMLLRDAKDWKVSQHP